MSGIQKGQDSARSRGIVRVRGRTEEALEALALPKTALCEEELLQAIRSVLHLQVHPSARATG